ncbi:class I SAM-dependent methyltransferase [Sulfurimonas sp. SAG-AH-194-I05]|nr:class I SAM-dependent methyltransferase [Sulfurimonas sp. SAG-AH-194-I05]MDF1875771.1 class I SAM-dependent methyltransferase [Sulfurimonas sp. SAG-AH-194-I05]
MPQNFIFKDTGDALTFVGDFDALYESEENPWGQSGSDDRLEELYKISRSNLIQNIEKLNNVQSICEVGCGLGYVTKLLDDSLKTMQCDGMDISDVAITKSKKLFPSLKFFTQNIGSSDFSFTKKYDVVILNQILWYILEDLENVFKNIDSILKKNGYLIISTLFLKKQRYGKEIIGSFEELISYSLQNKFKYKFTYAYIDYENTFPNHRESILVIQKNH